MTTKPDNPPAFPRTGAHTVTPNGECLEFYSENGISTLDYFAAKAMQKAYLLRTGSDGVLAQPPYDDADFEPIENPNNGPAWFKSNKFGEWNYWTGNPTKSDPEEYSGPHRCVSSYESRVARVSYDMAEAMLAERAKRLEGR